MAQPPGKDQTHQQGMKLDNFGHTLGAFGQFACQTVEPWIRVPGTAGKRHFGVQAAIGTLIMFLWIAEHNPIHATYAFYAQIGIYVLHKLAGPWMRAPGESTQYTGMPILTSVFRLGENACKGFWEPLLVGLAGYAVHPVSSGIGTWLWATALGLVIQHTYISLRDRAIDDARNDALALQRSTMRRWQQADAPPARPRSKLRVLLLMAALGGGGWYAYSSGMVPKFAPQPNSITRYEPLRNNRLTRAQRAEMKRLEFSR